MPIFYLYMSGKDGPDLSKPWYFVTIVSSAGMKYTLNAELLFAYEFHK